MSWLLSYLLLLGTVQISHIGHPFEICQGGTKEFPWWNGPREFPIISRPTERVLTSGGPDSDLERVLILDDSGSRNMFQGDRGKSEGKMTPTWSGSFSKK